MLFRLVKPSTLGRSAFGGMPKGFAQTRFLATVQNTTGRQMPLSKPAGAPVSFEPATFTIRVCGRFSVIAEPY